MLRNDLAFTARTSAITVSTGSIVFIVQKFLRGAQYRQDLAHCDKFAGQPGILAEWAMATRIVRPDRTPEPV